MSMRVARSSRCWLLIFLMVVACAPVFAQYTDRLGGSWNNPASATITNILMDRMARRSLEKRLAARRTGSRPAAPTAAAPALNDASLHFRPTGTHLKTREIANLMADGNAQVFALVTALLEEYEKNARAAGKPNDLALALSFFLATNASIYHDGGQPTDPQMLELREVIAGALVEGNAFNGVSDRQKQEMYEALVIYTGFTLITYQEGKQGGNAETVKTSQQLAGQNLLAVTGISPDKITFTAQGLNIEREPPAAAATATQSAPEPTSPQNAPAATVSAGRLVIDYEGNEVRANQLYTGKRIRVNGTVNSIEILKDGRITLVFVSPAMGYAHTRCYFNKSQSSRLAELKGGQEAIVEGTVRGFESSLRAYVEMENCIVP